MSMLVPNGPDVLSWLGGLFNPAAGLEPIQNTPADLDWINSLTDITEDERAELIRDYHAGAATTYLNDQHRQMVNNARMNTQMGDLSTQMRTDRDSALASARTNNAANISDAESQMARYQGDIDRYGNILTKPGAIRSDSEYGTALAQGENAIRSAQRQTQRQAAAATTGSGLRGSLGATDLSMRARETAGDQMGGLQAGMLSEVTGRKKAAEDARAGWVPYIGGLRSQGSEIEAGRMPSTQQIGMTGLQQPTPYGNTLEDVSGTRMAGTEWGTGRVSNQISQLVSLLSNMGQQGMNMGTSLLGMFKGG
jgi:hypothetical protein